MPSLYEQIKEEEKALSEPVVEEVVEPVEEETPDVPEEETDEASEEEVAEDELKEGDIGHVSEAAPAKEEKPDNAAFARLRYEAAEKARKAEELEKKLAEMEAKLNSFTDAKNVDADPEPNKAEDMDAWFEWKFRQDEKRRVELEAKLQEVDGTLAESKKREAAMLEQQQLSARIDSYEADMRSRAPDYDDVAAFYINSMLSSVKAFNPHSADAQLVPLVRQAIQQRAVDYEKLGINPIEQMYKDAKAMGYVPPKPKEEPKKSSVSDIEKNRKRSATSMTAGGQGGKNALSLDSVPNMTVGEISRLTPAQLAELEASG